MPFHVMHMILIQLANICGVEMKPTRHFYHEVKDAHKAIENFRLVSQRFNEVYIWTRSWMANRCDNIMAMKITESGLMAYSVWWTPSICNYLNYGFTSNTGQPECLVIKGPPNTWPQYRFFPAVRFILINQAAAPRLHIESFYNLTTLMSFDPLPLPLNIYDKTYAFQMLFNLEPNSKVGETLSFTITANTTYLLYYWQFFSFMLRNKSVTVANLTTASATDLGRIHEILPTLKQVHLMHRSMGPPVLTGFPFSIDLEHQAHYPLSLKFNQVMNKTYIHCC